MRFFFFYCIIAFSLFFQSNLKAQPALGFSDFWTGDTIQADLGDTIPFHFYIENKGDQAYSGEINIMYNANTLGTNISFATQTAQNLHPGDSMLFHFDHLLSPSHYAPGWNIIVIWPQSMYEPADSAVVHIYIEDVVNQSALPDEDDFQLILFQQNDRLYMHSQQTFKTLENVRIYNVSGQLVLNQEMRSNNYITISHLPSGIYFAEIELSDGMIEVRRFWLD